MGGVRAEARSDRATDGAPLVAILAPHAGRTLNATSLRIHALAAAFKPHPHKAFVFNGEPVAGKNEGEITAIDVALDGALIERVEAHGCRRQMLADVQVDLTALAAGLHTVTVTAYQGDPRAGIARSASTSFTFDPTLPAVERNRIEDAATPASFACLDVRPDDDRGRRSTRLNVRGEFVLGGQSNGIDPRDERVVVVTARA